MTPRAARSRGRRLRLIPATRKRRALKAAGPNRSPIPPAPEQAAPLMNSRKLECRRNAPLPPGPEPCLAHGPRPIGVDDLLPAAHDAGMLGRRSRRHAEEQDVALARLADRDLAAMPPRRLQQRLLAQHLSPVRRI